MRLIWKKVSLCLLMSVVMIFTIGHVATAQVIQPVVTDVVDEVAPVADPVIDATPDVEPSVEEDKEEEPTFEQDVVSSYEQMFICSAYYSPLPGQGRYATGSYAGDIRLNGSGVITASGREVFPGLIAAPRTFAFGTKMYIQGFGMGEIGDRGGAIKGKRLDLWFGHGEEALLRALQYGKRSCSVTVYGVDNSIQRSVGFTSEAPAHLARLSDDPFKFNEPLEVGDQGESVARLQQFLKDLGYYNGEANGEYSDSTRSAVAKFQVDQGNLDRPDIELPGSFGSATIGQLEAVLATGREKYLSKVPGRNFGRGAVGDDVVLLQEALRLLGYTVDVTGVYDQLTVEAVFMFQMSEGIVAGESDTGAGYFGPMTRAGLDKLMAELDNVRAIESHQDEKTLVSVAKSDVNVNQGLIGLQEGDRGDDVVALQELLRDLNYLRVEPTGYYGPLTAHAVFKFQQRVELVKKKTSEGAGIVDKNTVQQLLSYSSDVSDVSALLADNGRELKSGMRGADVKQLQELLKSEGFFPGAYTTEYFGDVTKEALIKFQLSHELINDRKNQKAGILDSSTRGVINNIR